MVSQLCGVGFEFTNALVEHPDPIFLHGQGVEGFVCFKEEGTCSYNTVRLVLEGVSRRDLFYVVFQGINADLVRNNFQPDHTSVARISGAFGLTIL